MADSTKPKLTYFSGRGLAEVIRLALHAARVDFDEVYFKTRDDFLQLINSGKLMFRQVPLLEMDGLNLIGSLPVLRYVCKKYGFMGKTDMDQTKIEMMSMGARDWLRSGFSSFKFQKTKEEQDKQLQSALTQGREKYLPFFEKTLSENKSGFLVGDSLTMVDLILFDTITYLTDYPELRSELEPYPQCRAFVQHFSNLPGIKEYLASPRRHPPPDEEYVRVVNIVLNW